MFIFYTFCILALKFGFLLFYITNSNFFRLKKSVKRVYLFINRDNKVVIVDYSDGDGEHIAKFTLIDDSGKTAKGYEEYECDIDWEQATMNDQYEIAIKRFSEDFKNYFNYFFDIQHQKIRLLPPFPIELMGDKILSIYKTHRIISAPVPKPIIFPNISSIAFKCENLKDYNNDTLIVKGMNLGCIMSIKAEYNQLAFKYINKEDLKADMICYAMGINYNADIGKEELDWDIIQVRNTETNEYIMIANDTDETSFRDDLDAFDHVWLVEPQTNLQSFDCIQLKHDLEGIIEKCEETDFLKHITFPSKN